MSLEDELQKIYDDPEIAIDGPSKEAKRLGRIVADLQD